MTSYTSAGLNQQWNFNTNVQSINMDAVKHERDRQAFIAKDMQRGSRAPQLTRSEKVWRDIIEPREAQVRSYSTTLSPFNVSYQGRTYCLPPVSHQRNIMMDPEKEGEHFSGLGYTSAMALTRRAAFDKMWDINDAIIAAHQKSQKKGFFKLGKKKAPPQEERELFSDDSLRYFFNNRLAEARVPLRIEWLKDDEYEDAYSTFFVTPSGETGNPEKSLADWSDKYWRGVPYKPWTNEVIEMPTSAMW